MYHPSAPLTPANKYRVMQTIYCNLLDMLDQCRQKCHHVLISANAKSSEITEYPDSAVVGFLFRTQEVAKIIPKLKKANHLAPKMSSKVAYAASQSRDCSGFIVKKLQKSISWILVQAWATHRGIVLEIPARVELHALDRLKLAEFSSSLFKCGL